MFNKKILAMSMATAITTGGMVAQTNAMQVAANGVGQVLLGGVFYAGNGYSTDMVVVNTRTDAAVQAKVVFRSHLKSAEILDFFIWLSPGDTWRGTLTDDGGLLHISSADDSVRNLDDTKWADEDPLEFTVTGAKVTASGDSTLFGHMEAIAWRTAGGTYPPAMLGATDTGVEIKSGIAKDTFVAVLAAAGNSAVADVLTQCLPAELGAAGVTSKHAPCSTELMGEIVIKNDNNRASYNMAALAADVAPSAAGVGYVMSNSALTMTTSADTAIGTDWLTGDLENVSEVEAALAATTSSFPWESNGTNRATDTIVTFPTKYLHFGDLVGLCGAGSVAGGAATSGVTYSAPFADTLTGGSLYTLTWYDNSENTTPGGGNSVSGGNTPPPDLLLNEVNYLQPAYLSGEDSGWAFYSWSQVATAACDYAGMPVLTYTYKYEGDSDFRHMLQTMANKKAPTI